MTKRQDEQRIAAGFRPDLATRAETAEAEVKRMTGIETAAKKAADIYEAEIERLRSELAFREPGAKIVDLLRAENERLRAALKPFADIPLLQDANHRPGLPDMIDAPDLTITPADVRKARTALNVPEQSAGAFAELGRSLTEEQDRAIYSCYLGICVLRTMCKKVRLSLAERRCTELLLELDMAFPGLAGRIALRNEQKEKS